MNALAHQYPWLLAILALAVGAAALGIILVRCAAAADRDMDRLLERRREAETTPRAPLRIVR